MHFFFFSENKLTSWNVQRNMRVHRPLQQPIVLKRDNGILNIAMSLSAESPKQTQRSASVSVRHKAAPFPLFPAALSETRVEVWELNTGSAAGESVRVSGVSEWRAKKEAEEQGVDRRRGKRGGGSRQRGVYVNHKGLFSHKHTGLCE